MKLALKILLVFCIILTVNSCKKTYEDGPAVSLRSKMNRITGKWKLVSMEGVDRLNPNTEQYMDLTKEEISDGVYRAYFTNFQEEFCTYDSTGDALFTSEGKWAFFDGPYGACDIFEQLEKKEGLSLFVAKLGNEWLGSPWKIFRLTNNELKIANDVCLNYYCFYEVGRTLTFEKE